MSSISPPISATDEPERKPKFTGFPIASLRDIIASKKASNRRKDLVDMELLEEFAREYAALNARPLSSAVDLALKRSGGGT